MQILDTLRSISEEEKEGRPEQATIHILNLSLSFDILISLHS